jgi:DNA-binding GntR family transcriptional regulator
MHPARDDVIIERDGVASGDVRYRVMWGKRWVGQRRTRQAAEYLARGFARIHQIDVWLNDRRYRTTECVVSYRYGRDGAWQPPNRRGPTAGTRRGDAVCDLIRGWIVEGIYPPGLDISAEEIARALKIGAIAVREALARLRDEELVYLRSFKRYRVAPLVADHVRELGAVRAVLEVEATRNVAEGASESTIAAIGRAALPIDGSGYDMSSWLHADEAFHLAIAHASGNRALTTWVRRCMLEQHRVLTLAIAPPPMPNESEHSSLLNALRERNCDQAQAAVREDLAKFQAMVENGMRLLTAETAMTSQGEKHAETPSY